MSDNKSQPNQDELKLDDSSTDFLQSINQASAASPPIDDPFNYRSQPEPPQPISTPEPQPETPNLDSQAPSETKPLDQPSEPPVETATTQLNDNKDWLEDSKLDLPGQLALDIYETQDKLMVVCRIAGVDERDLDVSISADNILNIRGTLNQPLEDTVDNYFIQECYWGEFSRSISLPVDILKDDIKATLELGILKISFPKAQAAVQKINIES